MKALLWTLSILLSFSVTAQERVFSIGPQLSTNGSGLYSTLQLDPLQKRDISTTLHFQLSNLTHQKETKIKSDLLPSPDKYTYGKARRAFHLSAAVGLEKNIIPVNKNAVGLSFGLSIGPDLAVTRPVYVFVIDYSVNENSRQELMKYNREVHNDQPNIQGDAGWTYGFSELQFRAGLDARFYTKINFDRDFSSRTILAGLDVQAYTKDLGMMLDSRNRIFSSLFISYQFGSKP